jgi:CRISPR-associated protein Csx1
MGGNIEEGVHKYMKELKVLIGIVGDYYRYKEAIYRFGELPDFKTRHTLLALECFLKPDITLSLLPESLAAPFIVELELGNVGPEITYSTYEKSILEGFEKWRKGIVNYSQSDFRTILLPYSGVFKINTSSVGKSGAAGVDQQHNKRTDDGIWTIRINGNFADFKYLALYELTKVFLEKIDELECEAKIRVFYDVTTGINSLNLYVYWALQNLLSILSAFYECELVLYNGIPEKVDEEYIFSEIEKVVHFNPRFSIKDENEFIPIKVRSKEDAEYSKRISDEIGKNEDLRELFNSSLHSLSAFYNGFILALLTFLADSDQLLKKLNISVNLYREGYQFSLNGKTLEIKKRAYFTESFVVYVLTALLSRILPLYTAKKFKEFNIKEVPESGVVLDSLENLYGTMYKTNPVLNTLALSEIDKIKQRYAKAKLSAKEGSDIASSNHQLCVSSSDEPWILYEEHSGEKVDSTALEKDQSAKKQGKPTGGKIDRRNFFAHAGLCYGSICIKREGEGLRIKYVNDESVIHDIKENLKEGILQK